MKTSFTKREVHSDPAEEDLWHCHSQHTREIGEVWPCVFRDCLSSSPEIGWGELLQNGLFYVE